LLQSITVNSDSTKYNGGLSEKVADHPRIKNDVLDALSAAHSRILGLYSFQDLNSPGGNSSRSDGARG